MPSAQEKSAKAFDHRGVAETARRAFILPGYRRLGKRFADLQANLSILCSAPSQPHLKAVRSTLRDAVDAWGQIELIMFGPIAEDNRFERTFFWPDRKSIGRRQVRAILTKRDDTAARRETLAQKSVAVQGLGALELMLYGKGSGALAQMPAQNFRCRYGRAIAANLKSIAAKTIRGWSDEGAFTKIWSSPNASNPVYLTPRETTLELIKSVDYMLEVVRDRRISPVIGFGRTRRRHKPVLWRSKLSMVLINANLRGTRSLFEAGLAAQFIAQSRNRKQARATMDSIRTDFKLLTAASGELAKDPDPFARSDIKNRLVALGFPLKSLRQQLVPRIKKAAGLSIGFNASDGD